MVLTCAAEWFASRSSLAYPGQTHLSQTDGPLNQDNATQQSSNRCMTSDNNRGLSAPMSAGTEGCSRRMHSRGTICLLVKHLELTPDIRNSHGSSLAFILICVVTTTYGAVYGTSLGVSSRLELLLSWRNRPTYRQMLPSACSSPKFWHW